MRRLSVLLVLSLSLPSAAQLRTAVAAVLGIRTHVDLPAEERGVERAPVQAAGQRVGLGKRLCDRLLRLFAITFLDSIFRGTPMIDPATTEIPDDVIFMSK